MFSVHSAAPLLFQPTLLLLDTRKMRPPAQRMLRCAQEQLEQTSTHVRSFACRLTASTRAARASRASTRRPAPGDKPCKASVDNVNAERPKGDLDLGILAEDGGGGKWRVTWTVLCPKRDVTVKPKGSNQWYANLRFHSGQGATVSVTCAGQKGEPTIDGYFTFAGTGCGPRSCDGRMCSARRALWIQAPCAEVRPGGFVCCAACECGVQCWHALVACTHVWVVRAAQGCGRGVGQHFSASAQRLQHSLPPSV
jgi:hypothetical protein